MKTVAELNAFVFNNFAHGQENQWRQNFPSHCTWAATEADEEAGTNPTTLWPPNPTSGTPPAGRLRPRHLTPTHRDSLSYLSFSLPSRSNMSPEENKSIYMSVLSPHSKHSSNPPAAFQRTQERNLKTQLFTFF